MIGIAKRITCMILLLGIVISAAACADSDDDLMDDRLYSPTLATSYMIWAELFGVQNLSEDFDVKVDEDGVAHVYVDLLYITSDMLTNELTRGMLMYSNAGYSETEMDLRAMALFAATEYGRPRDCTVDEVRSVRFVSMQTLNKMKQALSTYSESIASGEIIPFFIGEQVMYSIWQYTDGTQIIMIE